MAQKSQRKKREYQKFCRDQVMAGLINDETGAWKSYNDTQLGGAMHRMQRDGYKVGKRRAKEGCMMLWGIDHRVRQLSDQLADELEMAQGLVGPIVEGRVKVHGQPADYPVVLNRTEGKEDKKDESNLDNVLPSRPSGRVIGKRQKNPDFPIALALSPVSAERLTHILSLSDLIGADIANRAGLNKFTVIRELRELHDAIVSATKQEKTK